MRDVLVIFTLVEAAGLVTVAVVLVTGLVVTRAVVTAAPVAASARRVRWPGELKSGVL